MIKENPDAIVQFYATFLLCLNYKCIFFDDQDVNWSQFEENGSTF